MNDMQEARKAHALVVASQLRIESLTSLDAPNTPALVREAILCCLDAADSLSTLLKGATAAPDSTSGTGGDILATPRSSEFSTPSASFRRRHPL
jgi:hypothetical protein